MMKTSIRCAGLILLLSLGSPTIFAQSTGLSKEEPLKIGILDFQRLLSTAPQAKEAVKRLETELQGPGQKLNDKQNDFQTKRSKLQRDRDILSITERAKAEKDLAKLEQEIRRLDEELRAETTTRHREEMDDFFRVVKEVVEKFSREKQYDAILSQEVTIYYSDRVDITEQILERLQKSPKTAAKKG